MGKIDLVTNVVTEKSLREAQLRAMKFYAESLVNSYGPMGGLTAYSKIISKDADPTDKNAYINYTKDGRTILTNLQTDKPIEAMIKDLLYDITTQVVKDVGDGTTTATLASYEIMKGLYNILETNRYTKRKVIKEIKYQLKEASDFILKNGHKATIDDIYKIAYISTNGNEEISTKIKEIYEKAGKDVFIDVSESNTPETTYKIYDGMIYDNPYFSQAFINNPTDNTCVLNNPEVYIFDSNIDVPAMHTILREIITTKIMNPYMNFYAELKRNPASTHTKENFGYTPIAIFAPHISKDANSYLDNLINGTLMPNAAEVRPEICLIDGFINQYDRDDIRFATGAKFIKNYIDPEQYKADKKVVSLNGKSLACTTKNFEQFAGHAEKIIVSGINTRIIKPLNMYNSNGEYTEMFNNYIGSLESTLSDYEETKEDITSIGRLKRRINTLKSNMVDLHVGGIGISDRDSLTDSVEDAVLNCRSASKSGVGYGANFEGLKAFYNNKNEDCTNISVDVKNMLKKAYTVICAYIYKPYFDDNMEDAIKLVEESITENKPFNIYTRKFDDDVLTSINTEPSILKSISKIITMMFDTNQFLVPAPQFNIYEREAQVISDPIRIDQAHKKSMNVKPTSIEENKTNK